MSHAQSPNQKIVGEIWFWQTSRAGLLQWIDWHFATFNFSSCLSNVWYFSIDASAKGCFWLGGTAIYLCHRLPEYHSYAPRQHATKFPSLNIFGQLHSFDLFNSPPLELNRHESLPSMRLKLDSQKSGLRLQAFKNNFTKRPKLRRVAAYVRQRLNSNIRTGSEKSSDFHACLSFTLATGGLQVKTFLSKAKPINKKWQAVV